MIMTIVAAEMTEIEMIGPSSEVPKCAKCIKMLHKIYKWRKLFGL